MAKSAKKTKNDVQVITGSVEEALLAAPKAEPETEPSEKIAQHTAELDRKAPRLNEDFDGDTKKAAICAAVDSGEPALPEDRFYVDLTPEQRAILRSKNLNPALLVRIAHKHRSELTLTGEVKDGKRVAKVASPAVLTALIEDAVASNANRWVAPRIAFDALRKANILYAEDGTFGKNKSSVDLTQGQELLEKAQTLALGLIDKPTKDGHRMLHDIAGEAIAKGHELVNTNKAAEAAANIAKLGANNLVAQELTARLSAAMESSELEPDRTRNKALLIGFAAKVAAVVSTARSMRDELNAAVLQALNTYIKSDPRDHNAYKNTKDALYTTKKKAIVMGGVDSEYERKLHSSPYPSQPRGKGSQHDGPRRGFRPRREQRDDESGS